MFYHLVISFLLLFFFFFNDTAPTEIYTLSLHDALPIFALAAGDGAEGIEQNPLHLLGEGGLEIRKRRQRDTDSGRDHRLVRSEEHTSELQSRRDLVCRLLLEKKKTIKQ